ncbi:hypothetical protein V7S43_005428 [Phytophthora oleae]|uniref:Uncharacterized protein n=1 Tax=Phytophthora oleae TaxID=2107226 RepID=A0ABD3FRX0_9STRA
MDFMIPARVQMDLAEDLWVTRGERWVTTVVNGPGRIRYLEITNLSKKVLRLNRRTQISMVLDGDPKSRRDPTNAYPGILDTPAGIWSGRISLLKPLWRFAILSRRSPQVQLNWRWNVPRIPPRYLRRGQIQSSDEQPRSAALLEMKGAWVDLGEGGDFRPSRDLEDKVCSVGKKPAILVTLNLDTQEDRGRVGTDIRFPRTDMGGGLPQYSGDLNSRSPDSTHSVEEPEAGEIRAARADQDPDPVATLDESVCVSTNDRATLPPPGIQRRRTCTTGQGPRLNAEYPIQDHQRSCVECYAWIPIDVTGLHDGMCHTWIHLMFGT